MNLKQKTMIMVLVPLVLTTLGSLWYQVHFIKTSFEKIEDTKIEKVGLFIAPTLAKALWEFNTEIIITMSRDAVVNNDLREIVVTDENDKLVYSIACVDGELLHEKNPLRKGQRRKVALSSGEKEIGEVELFYGYDRIDLIVGKFTRVQISIILAQVALIVLAFYLALEYGVIRPIHRVSKAIENIAEGEGDLTLRVPADTSDETGVLARNFNNFAAKIEGLVKSVRNLSEEVHHSTQQLSTGNSDLLATTQDMSSSIEEIAATIEEMTSSIGQSAEVSSQTADKIRAIADEAQSGSEILGRMDESIQSVTVTSQRINEVVAMVNEIAFQINLLALNAAVEAARAGEHGRGFAVVASEVRDLSHKSAESAREIKDIVESNNANIGTATRYTRETIDLLVGMAEKVQKASGSMAELETSAQEQSSSMQQINGAVTQMDNATQRNATVVEELSSSADSLASISAALQENMQQFKVSDD
jgi:methyl-accepting chemotaxis protein